jgi:hypothetical protein
VDSNPDFIAWLGANLAGPRFAFTRIEANNALYPNGERPIQDLAALPVEGPFDLACMFSVITHQDPDETRHIFRLLRPLAPRLYFTAFITGTDGYAEGDPSKPRLYSYYGPGLLETLLTDAGWTLERIYAPVPYQQHAVIAR